MAVAAPRPSTRPTPRPARRSTATIQTTSPRADRSARGARRPALARWILWIALVGALLAGIVGLNVAVLELRMESGRLQSDNVRIRGENDSIQAELSTAAAGGRVETIARSKLGLVDATGTTYLKIESKTR
jgi:hypothetical protein